MSFYIKPPRGQINYYKLEECVKQRITCYDNLLSNTVQFSNFDSFDCLVEDSALDRTGHYLFRLFACCNCTFREVFLRNEEKLLLLRLNCYDDKKQLKVFLKTLCKQTRDVIDNNGTNEKISEICIWLFRLSCQILNKKCLPYTLGELPTSNNYYEEVTLNVPFFLCTSLIYKRDVDLHKGFVVVPGKDWKKLLLSLFNTYLKRALEVMKYSTNVEAALFDDRIKQVLNVIKNHWFKDNSISNAESKFDLRSVDNEVKFFPLCMLNLYKVLQQTNRLSHNDRFDFSLYLKGIGVSVSDSIQFWEGAYSKQHASCSKCTHDWKKNEKRYIYGIRHLYGLEGSRKNYQVRSCKYLQEKSLSATEDGGCCFKHFDDNNLRKVLKKLLPNKEDDVEVMIYERKENPSEACKLFYEAVSRTNSNKDVGGNVSFQNPVEYYFCLKNNI